MLPMGRDSGCVGGPSKKNLRVINGQKRHLDAESGE